MSCQVPVNLGDRSYEIHIEWGSLGKAAGLLESHDLKSKLFIVTHPELHELYGDRLQQNLISSGFATTTMQVPSGEASKSLEMAASAYDQMADAGLSRDSVVVALGGGVVGDLAGFAAATYMRGLRLVQIPTTLLSQVDASVGGKVAINHPRAKNLIGAFHQPSFVLIDPETLTSLSTREIRSGLAEVVKYGVIHDESFFCFLEENADDILALESQPVEHALRRSCEIKAWVVERDERELGLRSLLNFGHTIGHAIEAAHGYGALLHGECVSIGMVAATHLAVKMKLCGEEVVERLTRLLMRIGLPITLPRQPRTQLPPCGRAGSLDAILQAMKLDKKSCAGKLRFVLPERIGSVRLIESVDEAAVLHSVESVMEH